MLFIPILATRASKMPIKDSPAIRPDEKSIPFCKILSGSLSELFLDKIKCVLCPDDNDGSKTLKQQRKHIPCTLGA